MSRKTSFTTITSIPKGITRETVLEFVHNHVEMIDLNPLVIERHPCKPPRNATAEEYHCTWYEITDKVHYLPGGAVSGKVAYNACFHDLANGLQTHVYAPMGLDIRSRWTVGGNMPGEPRETTELGLGIPKDGLYLREDVQMKCNIMMTTFVRKTLKKAHSTLVDRLIERSHIREREVFNERLEYEGSIRNSYAASTISASSVHSSSNRPMSPCPPPVSNHPTSPNFPPPGYTQHGQHPPNADYDPDLVPRPLSVSSFSSSHTKSPPPHPPASSYPQMSPYNQLQPAPPTCSTPQPPPVSVSTKPAPGQYYAYQPRPPQQEQYHNRGYQQYGYHAYSSPPPSTPGRDGLGGNIPINQNESGPVELPG